VSSGVKSVVPMKPFSAQSFYRDIYQYKATILFAPPSELLSINSYLGNFSKKIPRAVSKIFIGSAPVLTGFLRNFLKIVHPATQVFCAYGLTEILPVALVDARAKIKWKGKGDLLGTITSGINYKIEEDKELVINAPQMCKRYFGNRNLTSVKTGDLVKVDNHELILLGRKKDMIIRGNYNIYPTLYENTISKIPDILACALVGIHFEEEADEKIILAIESRRKYSDNFRNKILLYLKNGVYSIDTIAFPDEIIFMTIPRKGRQGKIDKDQLLLNIRKTLL
jgi:acyl-CoA synthetase (AMP-forming)/AMP-acid ligase II